MAYQSVIIIIAFLIQPPSGHGTSREHCYMVIIESSQFNVQLLRLRLQFKSLKFETETETKIFKVSLSKLRPRLKIWKSQIQPIPRLKIEKSQTQDWYRDWDLKSLNGDTGGNVKTETVLYQRCQDRDSTSLWIFEIVETVEKSFFNK